MVPKGMSLIMMSAQFENNSMLHLLSSKQVVSTNTFIMVFTATLTAAEQRVNAVIKHQNSVKK